MSINPNVPVPKYGDFATKRPTPPPPPQKAARGPRPRLSRRWLLAFLVVAVAAGAFVVLKPSEDPTSSRSNSPGEVVGTLAEVKGTKLTLTTVTGASVQATTSESTVFTKSVPGKLPDVAVGDNVLVLGPASAPDAMTAEHVFDSGKVPSAERFGGEGNRLGAGFASGTVMSVNHSGFALEVFEHPAVTVAVKDDATTFWLLKPAQLNDFTIGQPVVVAGEAQENGTLEATSVRQLAGGFDLAMARQGAGGSDLERTTS